jgi:CDP-paratose 2-epimerase
VTTHLVTGGAGFVGVSLVRELLARGDRVVVLDDLSRVGSEQRLTDLRAESGEALGVATHDICDAAAVDRTFAQHGPFASVFHLAAQVAVTWAMEDPRRDFEVNAFGSFNIIDAIRRLSPGARAIYMSSNKVYGGLQDLTSEQVGERTVFADLPGGVGVERPLDPLTPYGVSKATGESYFRDAYRTYGVPSVVLRASCIYGPRQSQQEDQGWVSWFAAAITSGQTLRIFGDGLTTRDMLYIGDLVDLYLRILDGPSPQGWVLNVGGGPSSARSLLEVVALIEAISGTTAQVEHHPERNGDQKVFITCTARAQELYGWAPVTLPETGLRFLIES